MPPLPRSREGNENPKSHCHPQYVTGRRVSRQPEAGRPIHCNVLAGGKMLNYLFLPIFIHSSIFVSEIFYSKPDKVFYSRPYDLSAEHFWIYFCMDKLFKEVS